MQTRWVTAFTPALLALAVSAPALADAVPTPVGTCPPGARGASSHVGTWCEPTTCQTDLDCEKNANFWEDRDIKKVCREQALCVESRTENGQPGGTGRPFTREIAHGVCGVETSCSSPSTCQSAKRCVIPPPPKEPLLGCSLRPASPSPSPVAVAIAVAVAVALTGGRARRSPRT